MAGVTPLRRLRINQMARVAAHALVSERARQARRRAEATLDM